ncbi:MAG: Trm112 family protein [Gammaproteobacteria bacterium]|nr:Trm112 family protein [Gammaproteobacteria bacterium]
MKKKLMQLLVCPVCKGKLEYVKKKNEMICRRDGLAYPIRLGVPVLLEVDSRKIGSTTT